MKSNNVIQPLQLVRITPTGRISLRISILLKPVIKDILEDYINNAVVGKDLVVWSETLISKALIEEMYKRYYTFLHTRSEGRVTVTRAQALALWEVLYAADDEDDVINPQLGNFYMQLHQKLS
jgi:hypothetical protein